MAVARAARQEPSTILVVEDEPIVEAFIRNTLEQDYCVLSAADGQLALILFEQHATTLALMIVDIALPKMSGTDFVQRIPTLTPRIPVMFITGLGTHARQVAEVTRQNFPVLQKPFRSAQLLRAVAAAIARFRLECGDMSGRAVPRNP